MPPEPPDWVRATLAAHGPTGAAWLDRLPLLLAEASTRWGLTLGAPFAPLSLHYVAPATLAGGGGTRAVLKAGVPSPAFRAGIAALRHYAGRGCVRLLDSDEERGLLLLELLEPGTSLVTVADDAEATRIAAVVMRGLWRPPPDDDALPTVADLVGSGFVRLRARFGGGTGPFPPALVGQAEALLTDLLLSRGAPALLHGDLHHGNVLSAQRAPWLAIDPHGVIGEPAYEVGQYLLNPSPRPAAVLARRLDVFADELELDRGRLRAWGLVKAVLSAWWSFEDTGRAGDGALAVAQCLAALPA